MTDHNREEREAKKWHIEQGHVDELDNVLVEV